ncbi:MAG: hypothetical protein QW813_03160 [Candidatus Aenigmatarchaeota archaeon]
MFLLTSGATFLGGVIFTVFSFPIILKFFKFVLFGKRVAQISRREEWPTADVAVADEGRLVKRAFRKTPLRFAFIFSGIRRYP